MMLWQVVELLLLASTVLGILVEHMAARAADRDEEAEPAPGRMPYVTGPASDGAPAALAQPVVPYFYPWVRPNRATPVSCGCPDVAEPGRSRPAVAQP